MLDAWPQQAAALLQTLQKTFYPGYFGDPAPGALSAALLPPLREVCSRADRGVDAGAALQALLSQLPALRDMLQADAAAALAGDPAAANLDEVIFAYPSTVLCTLHRVAHALRAQRVPLLPRLLSEHAHSLTGADIHPAAQVGPGFFVDHATGVVVGATAVLGPRVRLYHGVTLGALSFPRDAAGALIRDRKRHPTLEADVVVYAHATILGGDTVIGRGSRIGAGAMVGRSLRQNSRIAPRSSLPGRREDDPLAPPAGDFAI